MTQHIHHAKAYPYPIPDHSYVYANGSTERLSHDTFQRRGRVPVLAAGSNQSPEQLHRKFAALSGDVVIPSQRGRLHDFDVVYAAHLARYGSIPATFQSSPGTRVTVFVLWLDSPQLARMHETEGNYTFDHLTSVRISLDEGGELTEAFAYSSKIGCLNHEGDHISLAEISAEDRQYPALGQPGALSIVRDRVAPGTKLDDFIDHHVRDSGVRQARARALGADALPLRFDRVTLDHLQGLFGLDGTGPLPTRPPNEDDPMGGRVGNAPA